LKREKVWQVRNLKRFFTIMKTANTGFSIEEILSKEHDDVTYHRAHPSLAYHRFTDDDDDETKDILIRPRRLLPSPPIRTGKKK
jgi:hypothetical protein